MCFLLGNPIGLQHQIYRGDKVNSLHPGVVATNFGANNGLVGKIMQLYAGMLGVKPAEGARTVAYLSYGAGAVHHHRQVLCQRSRGKLL